jgi:hypothetical protein
MKRWFLAAASGLLVSCVHPHVSLKNYTRVEDFTPTHARWLNEHCELMETMATTLPGSVGSMGGDRGNYLMRVGTSHGPLYSDNSSTTFAASLLYACSEPTPWPREDGALVRRYYKHGVESGAAQAVSCIATERPTRKFQIVTPGDGAAPTATSYARYRLTPVVVIPPGREREAADWGVVAGPRGSWVAANHVLCSTFRDALLKLRVGGKARAAAAKYDPSLMVEFKVAGNVIRVPAPETGPDMLEYDVELLEVGDVNLLYQQVGFTP